MPITSDASVLLAVAAVITRVLAHEHISVLADTVSLVLWDTVSRVHWLCLSWCPSEIISPDLNVVICELAQLVIIHAEELGFLRCAEVKTGDEVDGVGKNSRHDEGVAGTRDDVGDLDVELFVVVVGPAADNDASIDAVKTNNVGCAKEGVGGQAEHTGDTVLGEDIHGVVNFNPILDCK